MSPFLVYLLLMADDIKEMLSEFMTAFICASVFVGLAYIGTAIWSLCAENFYNCCEEGGKFRVNFTSRTKPELKSDMDTANNFKKLSGRIFKWVFSLTILTTLGACFMPTTKTIAAMIVLPKITSPQALEAMGAEAKDLYHLAKQGLEKLVAENKPAQAEQKAEQKPADAKKDDGK